MHWKTSCLGPGCDQGWSSVDGGWPVDALNHALDTGHPLESTLVERGGKHSDDVELAKAVTA